MARFSDTQFPKADGALMLEVTQRRLDAQQVSIDITDTKAGVALAIGSGLVAALFAVIVTAPDRLGPLASFFMVGSVIAYLAMAASLLTAMWTHKWGVGLEPDEIVDLHADRSISERDRVWVIAEGYAKAYNGNDAPHKAKVSRAQVGLALLVLETICLLASFAALLGRA